MTDQQEPRKPDLGLPAAGRKPDPVVGPPPERPVGEGATVPLKLPARPDDETTLLTPPPDGDEPTVIHPPARTTDTGEPGPTRDGGRAGDDPGPPEEATTRLWAYPATTPVPAPVADNEPTVEREQSVFADGGSTQRLHPPTVVPGSSATKPGPPPASGPGDRGAAPVSGPEDRGAAPVSGPEDRGAAPVSGPEDRGAALVRGPEDRDAEPGPDEPAARDGDFSRGPAGDLPVEGRTGPQEISTGGGTEGGGTHSGGIEGGGTQRGRATAGGDLDGGGADGGAFESDTPGGRNPRDTPGIHEADHELGEAAPSPDPVTARVPGVGLAPWRRLSSAGALIWVLLALFGFTLVVQLRSNSTDEGLVNARQEDLVRILSDLEARDTRLQAEITALETSQRQLTSGVQGRQAALAEADKRQAELGLLAGTIAGRGPGLKIGLDRVKASAVLNAVQELRGAGGEVMQLQGGSGAPIRIVASSYFIDDEGGAMIVDGARLGGPYTLWVIGQPQTMQTALQIPGGVVASVNGGGGSVIVEQRTLVEVTAVRKATSLQYARPVS